MDVVVLNVQLNHFPSLTFGEGPNASAYFLCYPPGEDSIPVLRNPDYVVLTVPNRV